MMQMNIWDISEITGQRLQVFQLSGAMDDITGMFGNMNNNHIILSYSYISPCLSFGFAIFSVACRNALY